MKQSNDSCDTLRVVQMEGIILLTAIFSFNAKHCETILDEVVAPFTPAGAWP